MALQVLLFGRALRHGVLAPVLVTFGLSVMIENLLQVAATSDPRGLNGGALALASFHIGSITVSWLFLTAFLTACAVLSGLQLLLSRTSWGRKVRATSDDLDTARLVGIRVRPVFATVAGIAVATAALAGVFIGTIGTFDPLTGTNILIFAFEAVVIGGIGSLWGTLAGGVILGVTQVVVGEVNQAYAVLAVNLLFLAVLTVRPGGLFTSHQAAREIQGAGSARMRRDTAVGSRDAEPAVTPVTVSRWSAAASAFTGVCVVAVVVLAWRCPTSSAARREQPLITLLTFIAMASLWNLLAGFSGLTSFGQHAYIGVGAYALYLVAEHGINPFGGIILAAARRRGGLAAGVGAGAAAVGRVLRRRHPGGGRHVPDHRHAVAVGGRDHRGERARAGRRTATCCARR